MRRVDPAIQPTMTSPPYPYEKETSLPTCRTRREMEVGSVDNLEWGSRFQRAIRFDFMCAGHAQAGGASPASKHEERSASTSYTCGQHHPRETLLNYVRHSCQR